MIRYATENEWKIARAGFVTSTEVASLFNLGEYKSEWQLWNEKVGNYSEVVEGERPKWGLRLENAIAEGVALDNGWDIDPENYRYCLFTYQTEEIASSIDRKVICSKRGVGLIECKVVSLNIWKDQFDYTKKIIPARFEFQLQTEMLCTGLSWAVLACLVDGQTYLFFRKADETIQSLIIKKARAFWHTVITKQEPKPDFMDEKDQEAIFGMFQKKTIRKEIDLSSDNHLPELCNRYREATAEHKMMELRKNALKAEIITKIGDAEKITIGDDYVIRSTIVEEKEISYIRSAYKDFRIFKKNQTKTITKQSAKTKRK